MTDSWQQSLDCLDRTLARRPDLRLRVVCPSQEFSDEEMAYGVGRWFSCVRGVWESLSLAQDRQLAVIMLQAPPVPVTVLRYLFSLLPGSREEIADCWNRHVLIGLRDHRPRHLSEKVLQATDVLARIRRTVQQARRRGQLVEGLSCFASSARSAQLADVLRLPLLATPPRTLYWGSKAGARRLFRRAGVPHPPGSYAADRSVDALCRTASALVDRHGAGRWLLKITAGFGSGHGNAILGVASPDAVSTPEALAQRLRPVCADTSPAEFLRRVREIGAVVEKYVEAGPAGTVCYPSVSAFLRRNVDGAVEIGVLGTHEQLIDNGQFTGCRFPAHDGYRGRLLHQAGAVLRQLVSVGVLGHVGIDFIARPTAGRVSTWKLEALEINLRQTGSTHPNGTVRALVNGRWEDDGRLVDAHGREVFYAGTDGLVSTEFRGIPARALVEALGTRPEVSYDATRVRGVIPHLWTTLEPFGKVGATFVGQSPADCDDLQAEFVTLLTRLGKERRDL